MIPFLVTITVFAFLAGFVVGLFSCMLSSQISRQEEGPESD